MAEIKLLSVVLPVYKQEKTIVKNIDQLSEALSVLPHPYEIIVVVDGFVDKTYAIAKRLKRNNVTVLGYKQNQGKGHAVRFGMLHADGDIIGFVDGGMEIDPTGISLLLNHMVWYDADIIVGSKLHPVSQVNYPPFRRVLSWGYRTLIRLLFSLKIRDTQVGIKFYKRKVVFDVFPRLLVKAFAFDIEVLAVAHRLGYTRIYEAPVKLRFGNNSTITNTSFWKIVMFMLWDTIAVFYRLRLLQYYDSVKVKQQYMKAFESSQ